jgi:outer membrane protein OmpA-like peptidoglycan-associated protein
VRKDGVLYFSSDGHPGLGALDIFTTTKDIKGWSDPVNQGMPLNGPTDDFAPTFNEDLSRGYFASDRIGGAGSDDIYAFKVTSKFVRISGKVLASKNSGDVMKNTTVELLSADGKLLKTTTTDANGNFKFENLSSDQSYIVRMNESDPSIASKPKYFMTDEKNNLVRVTVMNEFGGKYTFQNLPVDPAALPQLLSDDDYLTIAGNLISDGQPPQPIANANVYLKDDQGNLVQQTTTNEFGAFAFTRIPPDKTYLVGMDDGLDPKLAASSKISITNKSGKELMSTRPEANGKFSFRIIPEDKTTLSAMSVDDTELRMDMRGKLVGADEKGTALANTKVNILDQKGQVLQTAVTDNNGDFSFINLPADKAYLMSVDEVADPSLVGLGTIYIKDATGKIIRTLKMNGGKFEFRIIPLDRTTLGTVYVEDPWLQVLQMKHKQQQDTLLIIENIYYDYGDFKILPAAEITLEKVVKVMEMDPSITIEVSAHTDSRSTNDYNQKLSQKRAQAAVDYLVKRGIDKKRLIAIGYGETKLLNQCMDGVDCPEEEHAKNRRTEFKINRTKL